MPSLLTRKEVCFLRSINPSTLWRWEGQGLRFIRGRITEEQFAWWLEQADAARVLRIPILDFLRRPRRARERLLRRAHEVRCGEGARGDRR